MELKVIKEAWNIIERDPRELLGFDDSAAIHIDDKRILVVNIDTFDESTDWLPGLSFYDIGWRAIISSISDVIVKGGKPLGCLISLGVPNLVETEELREFYTGIKDACKKYELGFWGGDTNESKIFYVSVTSIGLASKVIPRSGARPGDVLLSTGLFGLNSLAYKTLLKGLYLSHLRELANVYRPAIPNFEEWSVLLDYVTSSIDSSDGLALSLHAISRASNVKIVVDAEAVIDPQVKTISSKLGLDAFELAFYEGGEEYTFLFTIREEVLDEVMEIARKAGLRIFKVGNIEEGEGVWAKVGERLVRVEERGWIHGEGWKR